MQQMLNSSNYMQRLEHAGERLMTTSAIAVAPNGGRLTKADHPALPITPRELADTARASLEAGAAMIHVHVRKPDGTHLLDADAYRRALAAIADELGRSLLVQITSEALGIYTAAEQMAVVRDVRPEAVSLALRELLPEDGDERAFAEFMGWLRRERVMTQIILYAPEEAVRLASLMERGLLQRDDVPVLYVLGRYTAGQRSDPADLLPFLAPDMPRFDDFMVCAFGHRETACGTAAALLGGDLRVGFENNRLLPNGETAPDNAASVSAARHALEACGMSIADADWLRKKWSFIQ
jgi:3-keto-5-aminohexanoate cleavage enzyme